MFGPLLLVSSLVQLLGAELCDFRLTQPPCRSSARRPSASRPAPSPPCPQQVVQDPGREPEGSGEIVPGHARGGPRDERRQPLGGDGFPVAVPQPFAEGGGRHDVCRVTGGRFGGGLTDIGP